MLPCLPTSWIIFIAMLYGLIPLSSAYTQSAGSGEVGAPAKKVEEKSPKTIQNEDSLDRQGGSNE